VFAGITRFDQLQRDLGVSRKVLSARLERLQAEGILERRPYSERPTRYDYVPTAKGADLFPVIAAVMAWGDRWTAEPEGPPAVIRHTSCGAPSTARVTCDVCAEPLVLDEVTTEAGRGGRVGHGTRVLGPLLASRRTPAGQTRGGKMPVTGD
jgi:DNA-binding HxlR family transcriptional regulator